MIEMKPLTKVNPSEEMTPQREAYDEAFTLACRYSRELLAAWEIEAFVQD